ncbi:hypothetical protein DSO57_1024594 [Entomophthora muscae]|uniref:Uncharacterized protein n=1 Tax=Entomophthora muscae TaxID=34485 RepID=A0ACC2TQU6_9FUNG|nr:hypothetical protein DSO57_1024594 [Entomophthora muscae]
MVLTCSSAAGPLTRSKRAKAPIAPGFMELPSKKVASKNKAKASVCPPMLTTPHKSLPLCSLWCPLLPPLQAPLLCLPLALLCFPLPACFLGLCLLGLWPCPPLFCKSLSPGDLFCPWVSRPQWARFPLGLSPPLGGGVTWFPPRVPAFTGEWLDPLGAYIHEALAPEVLLPQEVVFPKQDIGRAYRLVKNLTNKDLLALVAVASQVAFSQTGCHLSTEEHTLRLHHRLGVRGSVWTLLRSSFVGASEETWVALVPPSPTYLRSRDIEGSGAPTPLFSLLPPGNSQISGPVFCCGPSLPHLLMQE